MTQIWTPKDYQLDGRYFIGDTPVSALWWRMGRGKTVTTASGVMDLLDIGLARRCLIVAPLLVATQTWPNEFRKWEHLAGLNFRVIRGTAKQRRSQALEDNEIHLINWENLHWLAEEFKNDWRWDMVVLDESSKIKNQKSKMHKAVRMVRPHIKRMVQLTGTPAPNGLADAWGQIYLLDKGRRLGRTQRSFEDRWFFRDRNGKLQLAGERAGTDINERIGDIVYALRAAVTGNEPIFNKVNIALDRKTKAAYDRLETQAFLELESGTEVEPFNAAAVTGKLLQFAGGAIYTEHPKWEKIHDFKLKALGDIIDEARGSPMIVAYNSKHEAERILEAFPQARHIKDLDDVEGEWNSGKVPVLVMHPASGGHGLNLQYGGSTIVWFSLTWNLEHFEQLNGRLHGRHGQTEDVFIHLLAAEGTLDQEVELRLEGKASVQEALMIAAERRRK